ESIDIYILVSNNSRGGIPCHPLWQHPPHGDFHHDHHGGASPLAVGDPVPGHSPPASFRAQHYRPLHARHYEVLKGMAAFEEAKPVVSTHPRKDFAVPIRTIFS